MAEEKKKSRVDDINRLLITHLNQILKFIRPEFVHVLIDGRIVKEGGPELVNEIEANGFDAYRREV